MAPSAKQSIIKPALPLFTRLTYGVRLWFFKAFVTVALGVIRRYNAKSIKQNAPSKTKRYPARPMLENRVYLPKTWQPGTKLPLYIDIHGGGFALGDPQLDDPFCHQFCNDNNLCVVSINYRKAPLYPFPGLIDDAAEMARAVLADTELPIDLSKVAMGGFSAGGNISLAISQFDDIRRMVKGVIPVYPVVDFSGKFKGPYKPNAEGEPDRLEGSSKLFNWGYIAAGQDYCDPLLSPIYASKEMLPPNIFFVGVEYDYLCHEAKVMAKRLAGMEDHDPLGDNDEWTKSGIKWKTVLNEQHGFNAMERKGQLEVERKAKVEALYREMGDWLHNSVFVQ